MARLLLRSLLRGFPRQAERHWITQLRAGRRVSLSGAKARLISTCGSTVPGVNAVRAEAVINRKQRSKKRWQDIGGVRSAETAVSRRKSNLGGGNTPWLLLARRFRLTERPGCITENA